MKSMLLLVLAARLLVKSRQLLVLVIELFAEMMLLLEQAARLFVEGIVLVQGMMSGEVAGTLEQGTGLAPVELRDQPLVEVPKQFLVVVMAQLKVVTKK